VAIIALGVALPAAAQVTRGSFSGLVLDPTGAAVPGATVTITETETNVSSKTLSEPDGLFLLAGVLPGPYTLRVEAPGFEALLKTNLNLSAGERQEVPQLQLHVGSQTQTVAVTAEGGLVQLDSSDRAELVSPHEVADMQESGRNWATLLDVLPGGVGGTGSLQSDTGNASMPTYNGVSASYNAVYEDGVSNGTSSFSAGETPDVISELKVETSNYNAEYGGAGGANIQVISKSGTSQFHGDLFSYNQNEFFGANDFFFNKTGTPKPVNRFSDYGGVIGGPIFWPGRFNRLRNKLFFFMGQEYVPTVGQGIGGAPPQGTLTMPTALQRKGDFSQTTTTNGVPIIINDPMNNNAPFPGNVIPPYRINSGGQGLLNFMPMPNFINPAVTANQYNYIAIPPTRSLNSYHFYRIDWDPTEKLHMFWRMDFDPVADTSDTAANWPVLTHTNAYPYTVTAIDASYVFSTNVVNDFVFGMNSRRAHDTPDAAEFPGLNRTTAGVNIPQLYPQNNPLNLLPAASFGGGQIPNPPAITLNSVIPNSSWSPTFTGSDSITVVHGEHTVKAGIYGNYKRTISDAGSFPYNGSFDFSTNINNPVDANYPFANALLGNFNSYAESSARPVSDIRGFDLEWYVQDTWKASRRLTLNYGLRMFHYTPWHSANDLGVNFVPSDYNPAQAVRLYAPVINAQGQRVAQNPLNGQQFPAGFIGAIVPGSGNPTNGLVSASASGTPEGFMANPGVQYGPRFGFAYTLTNDQKTVLRGGFGMSYSGPGNQIAGTVTNTSHTQTEYSGTFATLPSAAAAVFPIAVNAINPITKAPTVMSYSLGVQRQMGLGTRLGVSYVGTGTRHIDQAQSAFDNVPLGAEFLAQNQDPTSPGKPLPDNYFRPYMGYSGITTQQFVNSNYNGLQVDAAHHFGRSIQFGANYTWSKTMGYYGPYPTFHSNALQYGATSLDRTNVFRFYYVYTLPKLSANLKFRPAHWVVDGWELSGLTQLQSGAPQSLACSFTYSVNLFGGGDYSRCNLTGPVALSKSQRTLNVFFNTTPGVILPPSATNPGNASPNAYRGPGINNWDVTVSKNFRFGESRYVQFRVETYNTWNHPTFIGVNNNAQFNKAGVQTNALLGQVTKDSEPRAVQIGLKVVF
jgi:hypothetical protein